MKIKKRDPEKEKDRRARHEQKKKDEEASQCEKRSENKPDAGENADLIDDEDDRLKSLGSATPLAVFAKSIELEDRSLKDRRGPSLGVGRAGTQSEDANANENDDSDSEDGGAKLTTVVVSEISDDKDDKKPCQNEKTNKKEQKPKKSAVCQFHTGIVFEKVRVALSRETLAAMTTY